MNLFVAGISGFNGGAGADDARFHFAAFMTCLGLAMILAAAYHLLRTPGRQHHG